MEKQFSAIVYMQLFYLDFSLSQFLNCLNWGLIYTLFMSTNPLIDFVKYIFVNPDFQLISSTS